MELAKVINIESQYLLIEVGFPMVLACYVGMFLDVAIPSD